MAKKFDKKLLVLLGKNWKPSVQGWWAFMLLHTLCDAPAYMEWEALDDVFQPFGKPLWVAFIKNLGCNTSRLIDCQKFQNWHKPAAVLSWFCCVQNDFFLSDHSWLFLITLGNHFPLILSAVAVHNESRKHQVGFNQFFHSFTAPIPHDFCPYRCHDHQHCFFGGQMGPTPHFSTQGKTSWMGLSIFQGHSLPPVIAGVDKWILCGLF